MSAAFATGWSVVAWLGLVVAIAHLVVAHRGGPRADALGWTWRAIALVGFGVTWTFMLRMAAADVARYPNVAAWAHESNLFFDAYRRVTDTPRAWWWSQQLMAWALVGTVWFAVEGRRRSVRFWPYPWLAMSVAVSVTAPIFAQRLRRERVVDPHAGIPVAVVLGALVAALALIATPFVTGARFVAAMLILHGGLLIPSLLTSRASNPSRDVAVRPFATVLALVCFGVHALATARVWALPGVSGSSIVEVVIHDPAQASITSDVGLTWLTSIMLVATSRGARRAFAFAIAAPFVSLGAAFAVALLLHGHEAPERASP